MYNIIFVPQIFFSQNHRMKVSDQITKYFLQNTNKMLYYYFYIIICIHKLYKTHLQV